jgi:hypothetical protein
LVDPLWEHPTCTSWAIRSPPSQYRGQHVEVVVEVQLPLLIASFGGLKQGMNVEVRLPLAHLESIATGPQWLLGLAGPTRL